MMRRTRAGAVLLAAALVTLSQQPVRTSEREPVTWLEGDAPIERPLAHGEAHRYAIALRAHECAHLVVVQRGVDVVVRTFDADDRPLAAFQNDIRRTGEEPIEIVSDGAGTYGVRIEAAAGSAGDGAYAVRIVLRHGASPADRAVQDARQLRRSAIDDDIAGRFADARAALERALAIVERERGAETAEAAAIAADLAEVYRHVPDDARSEALFERAIATLDRAIGPANPGTAVVRWHLARLLENMGQRAKAEALIGPALETIARSIGTDNRAYVGALSTVSTLQADAGDLNAAEETIRRGLAIEERIGDVRSLMYASLLNNLGENYRRRQEFARAGECYQRALNVGVQIVGEHGYQLATALQNLGIVARERKDYAAALGFYQRALSIRERVVGSEHPDVAQLLVNIANIYRAKGDTTDALATQFRALAIWEHAAGPYREATLLTVGNIARTYAAAGSIDSALAYQRRADAIIEKELELNLAIGSERQKLLFVNGVTERTDRTLSLHLVSAPHDAAAAALAALVLLQRKGRVQDAMIDIFAAGRRHLLDPHDLELLDQLKATTAELARVAMTADVRMLAAPPAAIAALDATKERLEAELSARSAALRAQMQPVTVEAVQAEIPEDAALVEFAVFRPFDPAAERNAEAYGAPHYAAYVLRRHAPPCGFDLGSAAAIDEAVDALRDALRNPRRDDVKILARHVSDRVLTPIGRALGDATRLIVSPDGDLNLVPFVAMVDDRDRYLVERYAVSYVTSGRDLLRMHVGRASRGGPVIFADPLFGEPSQRRGVTSGAEMSSMYFAPLPATAGEARTIKALFPDATIYAGARATKAALQRVEAPRMLHIAAHGFFLGDARARLVNPLLRSGLAFAGANLSGAQDASILTALEASELNLWGTKLVTLSACDTGVGDVRNGEGVYGLRRAFVLAGTETLVMTLWPVGDAIARETMVSYYTELRAGLGRGDALRQSKLAMLAKPGRTHPYYWAAFIQSGAWTSLDGGA